LNFFRTIAGLSERINTAPAQDNVLGQGDSPLSISTPQRKVELMAYKIGSDIEIPVSPSKTYSTDDLFHAAGVSSEEMLLTESPEGNFVPIERGRTIVLDGLASIWSCPASFRESLGPLKKHFKRLRAAWSAFVTLPRLPDGCSQSLKVFF